MMKVLITGSSSGIGRAIALKFLYCGHEVVGFDRKPGSIDEKNYSHFIVDVKDKNNFPEIDGVEILINNAGTQNENDIDNNLKGTIYITEKYGVQKNIKAIVNIASSSAHSGSEFPEYAASKGGMLAYTKNVALRVAEFGATCNSVSPGGVVTKLNEHILKDEKLWQEVLSEALLHKWASVEEIAEWVYFVAVINKSMTAQDVLIDNGEIAKSNFVW